MSEREKLLVVDDEESIRGQLKWGLSDEYEVLTAATADDARRVLRDDRPRLVTLDVTLTPRGTGAEEGMALLSEIVERHPLTKVVMVTGNASRENALLAIERGAVDWVAKPIELDELRVILKRAIHVQRIESARGAPPSGRRRYHRLVGESEAMRKVFTLVQRVAPTDATVLVLGDNGTGKELVAHAIHEASARRGKPFIPISCGAIPETLIESELFGHERGAFTDAYRSREGKIELADGGTLFLDEIGELPAHLQVKLLRFLQERVVERIGGRDRQRVDVRVVAATNRDLKAGIADGSFREDVFYRLSVVTIHVPPLRERGDDVRILAETFLEEYARVHKRKVRGFTQAALRAMMAYPWPGNVRELENRIQRGVILASDAHLRPEDLELDAPEAGAAPPVPLQAARDEAERRVLVEALTRNAGNITRAAKDLDVSRPTLHDLLRKHGLDAARFRRPGGADVGGPEADDDGGVADAAGGEEP